MKKILFLFVLTTTVFSSTYWGAIAINRRTGHTGWSYDYSTESAAMSEALKGCEGDCEIGVSFYNSCAAIAHSAATRRYGDGWNDSSQGAAEKKALATCGQKDCRILQSVCTSWETTIWY